MGAKQTVAYKKTTLQIPADLHRQFKTVLASRGLEMKDVLGDLVQTYVDQANQSTKTAGQ